MSALEARDVFYLYRASYGDVAALRGLSLEVAEGETVAVLGPSGAGKSTLLALCAALATPSSGDIRVLGLELEGSTAAERDRLRARQIGIVRQHYHEVLPPELTAREIVALPLRLRGRFGPRERRYVQHLLEQAGLRRRADARPTELSGGEQQRVAVCAALAKTPRLLVADEPTGELDATSSQQTIELLLGLASEAASTCLIVTHDPRIAARTDRTIHIRDGRLAAEGAEHPLLVVDRQGWLRLPEGLRQQAGLSDRVRASARWGEVRLRTENASREPQLAQQTPRPTAAEKRGEAEIALDRIRRRYPGNDDDLFAQLSWTFAREQLHVLAGPSGSGKTTLLNLVAALDRPDDGAVWVAGERIDCLEPDGAAAYRRRCLGYLSQHATLVEYMSAKENVELALHLRGLQAHDSARRAAHWLDWVGLGALADRRADQLSGGEQRRVALARAMAPNPRVLVADEPTAHLDRFSGRIIIRLLLDATRERGTTILAASHDPDLITAADTQLDLSRTTAHPTTSDYVRDETARPITTRQPDGGPGAQ
jgi:ABC-type lipoprotein export system ATPase subunit